MPHSIRHDQRMSRNGHMASPPDASEITVAESSGRVRPSSCDTSPVSIANRF